MTDSPRVVGEAPLTASTSAPSSGVAGVAEPTGSEVRRSAGHESSGGDAAGGDASAVAPRPWPEVVRLNPGGSHDPILCGCTRCKGFQPGNPSRLTHGVYASPVRLAPETNALAEELAPLVPIASEADAPAVQLLALALVRIGKADAAITAAEDEGDADKVRRLDERARHWTGTALRLLTALGMTPTARAQLARDAAQGVATQAVLDDLLSRGRELRLGRNS